MNDVLVAFEAVDFGYPGRPLLFRDLEFALHRGEQIGLHGPNGCGKTTFFRLLTGLEKPQRGSLAFHGRPVNDATSLHRLRCSLGLVLQNSDDQLFSPSVLEDAAFGPLNLGLSKADAKKRALEALRSLGIEELADRPPHRLSGGEKKLAALASVLSMKPEALLLDEPTIFLDDMSRERLLHILSQQKLARIVISHDREFLEATSSLFMRVVPGGGVVLSERIG